ncbi:MAG TPA: histidinol-phosphate transaminase [Candidatus Saccharimonadales bacterium]
MAKRLIQLQFGVNFHAEGIYKNFKPPQSTAFYPDFVAEELRAALASYTGVPPEMVVCGHGSDELVDVFIRLHFLLNPQLIVAEVPPNYYQYRNYAQRLGLRVVSLEVDRKDLRPQLFLDAGCTPENSILMLDSPANPSGEITSKEQFIELLEAGYHVFADEAYFEFHQQTVIDLVSQYERLVVSRTLSKIAAMAGSRIGYIIAQPQVAEQFRKHKLFFNISVDSQARALFALKHMPEFQQRLVRMRQVKEVTAQRLRKVEGYKLFPSLDMYTIFAPLHMPTKKLHGYLGDNHGILTYLFERYKGESAIRATVGKLEDMKQLIEALKTAQAEVS